MTMNYPTRRLQRAALACLCGLALSGCLKLKPVADPARFFVLAASLPPASAAPAVQGPALGLALASYPSYLDSNRLALRKSKHEILYLDWVLWAEHLDRGLLRVLGLNLTRSLQNATLQLEDWKREAVDFEVWLDLVRFEPDERGLVTLEVDWRIVRPATSEVLRVGTSQVQKQGPPLPENPDGAVATLSAVLADFARELAQVLKALPTTGGNKG
jgi:uncharacterized lipoprotein YmbA